MMFALLNTFKHGSPKLCLYFAGLVIGEYVGLSSGAICEIWRPLSIFCIWLLVALHGFWGVRWRCFILPAVILFGVFNGAATESARRKIIDSHLAEFGATPQFEVEVESDVDIMKKKDGVSVASFYSSLGPVPVKVKMNVGEGEITPSTGEVWLCRGWLGMQKRFDEKPFACRTLWVGDGERERIETATAFTTSSFYKTLAGELANRVSAGIRWSSDIVGINKAVLLGQRNDMSKNVKDIFRSSGTIHLVAISGLHVGLIASLLMGILNRLEIGEPYLSMIAIPAVVAYTMLTGARPSAIRAAVMFSLWRVGPILRRESDSLSAWAVTALGVYALSPEMIFDVGCTLSFVVMLGIILWKKWTDQFNSLFEKLSAEAELLEVSGDKLNASKLRNRKQYWDDEFGSAGVAFAAWIAGTPIVAMLFECVTPGGLLANLIVIRISGRIVKLGITGILAGLICLPLGAIFNNLSAICTLLMMKISELVTKIPYCTIKVAAWDFHHCLFWYGFWFCIFYLLGKILPRKKTENRKWWG